MWLKRSQALRLTLVVCALAGAGAASGDEPAPAREREVVAWQTPERGDGWRAALERAALQLPRRIPVFWTEGARDLGRGRATPAALWTAGSSGLALMLLWALARLSRRRGQIAVCLEYPAGLRGTFCVRLATRASGARTGRFGSPADAARARGSASSSQTVRFGVSRETLFLAVPCQRHYVSVDGYLQTAESEDVVASLFSEQEVHPRRGETARLRFDFEPRACPVEVRVAWDRRAVDEAGVARQGVPGSLRRACGPVQYSLDRGMHKLVAGSTDRVAEVQLEIESFEPRVQVIDLGEREQLVFTGCPRAVEPYLNGDVPAAARALERDGQHALAHRLLARFHEDQGRAETAARHWEQAEDAARAAELWGSLGQFEKAARLYERIGDDERAGEMYRSAGKLVRAGEAYVRADAWDSAVECFRRAGDVARWIEALSKRGDHLAAAQVAFDQGDRSQAVQCLSRVGAADPAYPEAALRLAQAYQSEGHLDLAVRKLEELRAARPAADVPAEALDRLAALYEETREYERALDLLESLRTRDATWPNVASRVEAIRKLRSAQTTEPDLSPASGAKTGFGKGFRYEILEEIGRGGMGVVFRARDRRLGREVALKRLPDNIRNHPKAIELFLREARAAAALNHPNIVTLFDASEEQANFYITMELLQGQPLQKILRDKGRLPAAAVAKLGGQAATGLQYAHEQGIVHRDIKTANFFFTNSKVVKIMDFGLAKMVEEVRRSSTVIGGTPFYMAPEQSAGEQVDHRADLYALGVTFFELLTGSVPFKDGDVAFHHRHTPPPDVRETAPETPEPLAELVAALLAKRPADRIRSAAQVVRRLAEIARGS